MINGRTRFRINYFNDRVNKSYHLGGRGGDTNVAKFIVAVD
jgi:hypothetical protein